MGDDTKSLGHRPAQMTQAYFQRLLLVAIVLFGVVSCSAKRPVLYPNGKFESAGSKAVQRDINECIELAKDSGADSQPASEVAGSTAGGAVVGGAVGGAVGGVYGDAGRRASAGAAAGATGGFFRGLFRSRDPDPVFRGFVERCLRNRGYDTIGWR